MSSCQPPASCPPLLGRPARGARAHAQNAARPQHSTHGSGDGVGEEHTAPWPVPEGEGRRRRSATGGQSKALTHAGAARQPAPEGRAPVGACGNRRSSGDFTSDSRTRRRGEGPGRLGAHAPQHSTKLPFVPERGQVGRPPGRAPAEPVRRPLPPRTGVVANGHVTAVTTPSDARPHWKAEVQPGGQTSLPQAAPTRTGRGVQAPEAGRCADVTAAWAGGWGAEEEMHPGPASTWGSEVSGGHPPSGRRKEWSSLKPSHTLPSS